MVEDIEKVILQCSKCRVVDKPPCIFKVYRKYLPNNLRTLIVSESPPPGLKSDYLYNLSHGDRLRNILAKVFKVNEKEVVNILTKKGIFWTTAIKCRPYSRRELEFMRRNCREILLYEIKSLNPKKIVALGTIAWKTLDELNIQDIQVYKYYHPLYLARFNKQNLETLKRIILDGK